MAELTATRPRERPQSVTSGAVPVRWVLRVLVIGYLFLLVIWPVGPGGPGDLRRAAWPRCWTR